MSYHASQNTKPVDDSYKSFIDLASIEGNVQKMLGELTIAYTLEMAKFTNLMNKLTQSQAKTGAAEANAQKDAGISEAVSTGLSAGGGLLGTAGAIGYNQFGGGEAKELESAMKQKGDELGSALNQENTTGVTVNPGDEPTRFNAEEVDALKAEHAQLIERYRHASGQHSAILATMSSAAAAPAQFAAAGARATQGSANASASLARSASQISGQGVQATQGTAQTLQQSLQQIVSSTNPYQAAVSSSRNR